MKRAGGVTLRSTTSGRSPVCPSRASTSRRCTRSASMKRSGAQRTRPRRAARTSTRPEWWPLSDGTGASPQLPWKLRARGWASELQPWTESSGVRAVGAAVAVVVVAVAVVAVALAVVAVRVVVVPIVAVVAALVVTVAVVVLAVTAAAAADDLAELSLIEDVDVRAAGQVVLDHGGASFFRNGHLAASHDQH